MFKTKLKEAGLEPEDRERNEQRFNVTAVRNLAPLVLETNPEHKAKKDRSENRVNVMVRLRVRRQLDYLPNFKLSAIMHEVHPSFQVDSSLPPQLLCGLPQGSGRSLVIWNISLLAREK